MSIKQDKSLIKDCIHDVFLTVWNSRNRLGNTDNIKLYLFKCLSNRIYREVGRDKKRYSTQTLDDYEEVGLNLQSAYTLAWKSLNSLKRNMTAVIFLLLIF